MSFWIRLVLAVLATWRVTHLLASEDGPADLIVRFRALFGQSAFGRMMDCFNCLSLWVAAPLAPLVTLQPVDLLLSWLALSGGACLLERLGHDSAIVHPVMLETEGDVSDGMLRSEQSVAQEPPDANQNARTGQRS